MDKEPTPWPRRSRHFLRIGKSRFVPILLFVQSSNFGDESLDVILSSLYDKLPQELVLEPHSGMQMVASPFHPLRPCHVNIDGLHYCYYWIPTPNVYNLVVERDKLDLNQMDGKEKDSLFPTNMTLILCVLSQKKVGNQDVSSTSNVETNGDLFMDLSAVARPTTVSHYFASNASSSLAESTAASSNEPKEPDNAKSKKRKRGDAMV